MTDFGLDLAVIGNGRTAALLEPSSRIVWWCLPRYDGDPVFCRLLAGNEDKGFTDVVLDGQAEVRSNYVRNTAIVITELVDADGGGVRITDFAPRFQIYGRTFRPPQSYSLLAGRRAGQTDDRCAPVLCRERIVVCAHAPRAHGVRHR